MIPLVPLLRRLPLFSPLHNVSYNPHTLFIKYPPQSELDNDPLLSLERSFGYNWSLVHEFMHWFQHHGTSVGCFLSEVRRVQRDTTLSWLKRPTVRALFDKAGSQRRSAGYSPIVSTDQHGGLVKDGSYTDSDISLFRQIWHDHQLVDVIISSSDRQDRVRYPRGQVFGEVTGDILYYCDFGDRVPSLNEATAYRSFFSFADENLSVVDYGGQRLTTWHLMEGMALASEMYSVLSIVRSLGSHTFGDSATAIARRGEALLSGAYGLSFRLFLSKMRISLSDNIQEILCTYNCVVDIALNPPLPPCHTKPPRLGAWRWKEIYPPLRFVEALRAVSKVGFLRPQSSSEALADYRRRIYDVVGWYSEEDYHTVVHDKYTGIDFDRPFPSKDELAEKNVFWDYIRWTQKHMRDWRKSALPIMTNLGERQFGVDAPKILQSMVAEDNKWVRPPLTWASTDQFAYKCTPKDFENALALTSACEYMIFDLVTGHGAFDLSVVPSDMRANRAFRQNLTEVLLGTVPSLDLEFA